MPWSNVEVQSVEIVQDMSYSELKERFEIAKNQGNEAILKEINRNFNIAICSTKKCTDMNTLIFQCDNSLKIILSTFVIAMEMVSEIIEYNSLEKVVYGIFIAKIYNNYSTGELYKAALKCNEYIKEEIELLEAWGDEHSLKKAGFLKELLMCVNSKSVFDAYATNIVWLIEYAVQNVTQIYKYAQEFMFEHNVIKMIEIYMEQIRNDMDSNKKKRGYMMLEKAVQGGIEIYNKQRYGELLEQPFVSSYRKIIGV